MSNDINNHWLTDVRVRERYIRRGLLDAKDVVKHLETLPDLTAQSELIPLSQPALDELATDDEDEDDDDDD